MNEKPFCCRCKEEFSVCQFPEGKFENWHMGELRKLKFATKKIQRQLKEWLNSEIHGEGWLCGNCYFDLTGDG